MVILCILFEFDSFILFFMFSKKKKNNLLLFSKRFIMFDSSSRFIQRLSHFVEFVVFWFLNSVHLNWFLMKERKRENHEKVIDQCEKPVFSSMINVFQDGRREKKKSDIHHVIGFRHQIIYKQKKIVGDDVDFFFFQW